MSHWTSSAAMESIANSMVCTGRPIFKGGAHPEARRTTARIQCAILPSDRVWKPRSYRWSVRKQERRLNGRGTRRTSASVSDLEYDVVIVGAGVVGTATAHHILANTQLSVALIDAQVPCSGATGAGQGYIWMAHRKPGTAGWALAKHGKSLWESFALELQASGANVKEALGLRRTGSLLVSSTSAQAQALQNWIQDLSGAGIPSTYLAPEEAVKMEPSLASGYTTGAAYFNEDFQIDAILTMKTLQQRIRQFEAGGRYKELFHNQVQQFIRSSAGGSIIGVEIPEGKVFSRSTVVIACGAWSSTLMETASTLWGLSVVPPVKPRKGHLLVVEGAHDIQLKSGIMEVDYLANYLNPGSQGSKTAKPTDASISMTATMDPNGNLLLGSSREFTGFNVDVESDVIQRMVKRAALFLPGALNMEGKVRTGLRPYSHDGKPLIGPVEGLPGLIFATGHEGSGLCLALATAEMVTNMITEVKCPIDPTPFLPAGRLLGTAA